MKKISLVLSLVIIMTILCACSEPYSQVRGNDAVAVASEASVSEKISGCNPEKYTMDLTLDTEKDTISGDVIVDLTNMTDDALTKICFRLYSATVSSGSINKAENTSTGTEYEVAPGSDKSVIYVDLAGDSIDPGKTVSVKLNFTSIIPDSEDRFGVINTDNGKLYNMTFCFPQIAFLENGKWFEDAYIPEGEARFSEMSDYYVTLKAPADYTVVSSGKSSTTDGVTTIDAPGVREMAIAACNFADVISKTEDGIKYNVLAVKFSDDNAEYYTDMYNIMLDAAIDSVNIFSELVGNYIYDEIDIVPLYMSGNIGGMEMPGFIQIAVPKNVTASDEGYSEVDYTGICQNTMIVTAHEMGHQWFYCAVGNNEAADPWLDESFTSFLEYYYVYKSDKLEDTADAFNKKHYEIDPQEIPSAFDSEDGSSPSYVNLPTNDYGKDGDYSLVVYDNGAWFLRKLELTMGSEKFFEMLSEWYTLNTGKIAGGAVFVQHVLKYDSSDEVKDVINYFLSDDYLK